MQVCPNIVPLLNYPLLMVISVEAYGEKKGLLAGILFLRMNPGFLR